MALDRCLFTVTLLKLRATCLKSDPVKINTFFFNPSLNVEEMFSSINEPADNTAKKAGLTENCLNFTHTYSAAISDAHSEVTEVVKPHALEMNRKKYPV